MADLSTHYAHGNLVEAIRAGLASQGKSTDSLTIDDLGPVDEFHIGGRKASEDFLDQLAFSTHTKVLDVGCGLGAPARFVASRYGSQVTGIDLTSEYVETGSILCKWVGLDKRVSLHQGSALAMPFAEKSFDGAYMLHVGMNIKDKATLADEVERVLRPGAVFGIYYVMQTAPGDLAFPVPWASTADLSAVVGSDRYKSALRKAGFNILAERNSRDFALASFAELRGQSSRRRRSPAAWSSYPDGQEHAGQGSELDR
jgi:SAM-dependent methyltransferase